MRHSESIKAISAALFALQKELEPVKKDSTNPHFKNRYASLEAINEYVIELANKHGLLIVQGGGNEHPQGTIIVETLFIHVASGEWMASDVIMPLQRQDPQGAGSAITYGRRYNLCAMLCISTEEDDDGEGAVHRPPRQVQSVASQTGHQAPPPQRRAAQSPAPSCPKCGSDMWDNRGRKTNPRAPDFRCKDRANCDGAIWQDSKPQQSTQATQQRVAQRVQEAPPPPEREPWEEEESDLPF